MYMVLPMWCSILMVILFVLFMAVGVIVVTDATIREALTKEERKET